MRAGASLLFCAEMVYLFYVLIVQQLVQGAYSLWQGVLWLQMCKRRLAKATAFFTPRVALFCPVKGMEPGLAENLAALMEQDYRDYEIFFAISGVDDPAYRVLEHVAASSKRPVHIVRAGRAKDCGDKVNNLRVAVEQAGENFDIFVFADSDGRPSRRWLGRLVAPLADSRLGAVTTFRWLIPLRGGFWSALASAWNASIATYLGEHNNNFCWGGGTAIRRSRFEEARVAEAWRGSVSDDYSLTNAVRRRRLQHRVCAGMPGAFAGRRGCARIFRIYDAAIDHHAGVRAAALENRGAGARVLLRGAAAGAGFVGRQR